LNWDEIIILIKEDSRDLLPVLTLTHQQSQGYNDADEADNGTAYDSKVFWDPQGSVRAHSFMP